MKYLAHSRSVWSLNRHLPKAEPAKTGCAIFTLTSCGSHRLRRLKYQTSKPYAKLTGWSCLFAAPNAISGHGSGGSTAFGLIMTGRNLGVFAGPILVPIALALVGSWSLVGPIFGGIALAAALSAVFLGFLLRRRDMIAR